MDIIYYTGTRNVFWDKMKEKFLEICCTATKVVLMPNTIIGIRIEYEVKVFHMHTENAGNSSLPKISLIEKTIRLFNKFS